MPAAIRQLFVFVKYKKPAISMNSVSVFLCFSRLFVMFCPPIKKLKIFSTTKQKIDFEKASLFTYVCLQSAIQKLSKVFFDYDTIRKI